MTRYTAMHLVKEIGDLFDRLTDDQLHEYQFEISYEVIDVENGGAIEAEKTGRMNILIKSYDE